MRRRFRIRRGDHGFALIALLALLAAGVLYFVVTSLSPQVLDAYRTRKTQESLATARDALVGYALQYRDQQMATGTNNAMYGYLPLPDLGTFRNNNIDPNCHTNPADLSSPPLEGCDAAYYSGISYDANGMGSTVIGRVPWRKLGIEPLRDGYGECLWLIVSSSHGRILRVIPSPATPPPMNWDTLGQLDVVVANGANNLASVLTSVHDRPVAIIFSAGSPLPGQNRNTSATDDVGQCGGNYDVANYLDPDTVGALAGVTNYFGGSTNSASGSTRDETRTAPLGPNDNTKRLSTQGTIYKRADNTLWPSACPSGTNCTLVANDAGLALTSDMLFGALRKSLNFRLDINSMLDEMVGCLRDQMAAGGSFIPQAINGYASPGDKSAGRIQSDACFNTTPPGYFNHWQDMFFVAKPTAGNFTVTVDAVAQSCNGVLVFAGQRGVGQSRSNLAEQSLLANYLEGTNLASFTAAGSNFSGQGLFDIVSAIQTAQQDIVRCIPTTASFLPVNSADLIAQGFAPLASYDPGSRTLTLGAENATTGAGAPGADLYGCAWTPEAVTRGKGFRGYFQFRFKQVGTDVGNNGFVFAAVDGESNSTQVCGAAGSHLGYSGNNGVTPPVASPKIGIEFDQGRNAGFNENALNPGRNDPCGTSSCGGSAGYNSHAAIVYWGHETTNATDGVTLPGADDNVHGFPTTGSESSNPRPPPQNPLDLAATTPGIAFVNLRGQASEGGDSYLYDARIEVTPIRNVAPSAELATTTFVVQAWIERDSSASTQLIAAMQNTTRSMAQLYPGYAAKLSNTATVYDVPGAACGTGCPTNQTCGTDNICYRQALKSVRLGFTGSQRTQDQQVLISNFFASWLQ